MPYFHEPKPKYTHVDGRPVAVLASFKPNGDFIPLQFVYQSDDEELHRIKIDAISSIKDTFNIKSFVCKYTEGNRQCSVVLKFNVSEHRWFI